MNCWPTRSRSPVAVKTTEELPAALPTVIAWVSSVCAATAPDARMPRMAASTNDPANLGSPRGMFAPETPCNLVIVFFGTLFNRLFPCKLPCGLVR